MEPVDKARVDAILSHYPHAFAAQRWHMRARLALCPYAALDKHLQGEGSVLDVGCGFGHLAWYLAEAMPELEYFGSDIDERKIALASRCPAGPPGAEASTAGGRRAPRFRAGDVRAFSDWRGPFGNIVFLDVLYLLPWDAQAALLEWALSRLAPGTKSSLVLKSMDEPEGISGLRALAEEWIMVNLLGRTRSSGTIRGARGPESYLTLAQRLGFTAEVEDLGTYNPSYILRMHR